MKKVVIIGGGFAGLNLAKSLSGNSSFDVLLVDKNNYNFFPPLLYQVASGFLETSSISYPFRKIFSKSKNIQFRLGELLSINIDENKIKLSNGEVSYDYLIIATGTTTNYFGMEGIKKYAIPMKTLEDALNMRNILLQRAEAASISNSFEEKEQLLRVVIAGGGPTGVEIAGIFAEMSKSLIAREYPELSGLENKIILVDGGNSLLSPMSMKSQEYTLEAVNRLGVEVILNNNIIDFDGSTIYFKDGREIKSKNLIWAAGVTAIRFEGLDNDFYGPGSRLIVDEYNKVIGSKDIYAIGDTSIMFNDVNYPKGHPQVAQVAMQQAENLRKNLIAKVNLSLEKPFLYKNKGSMAIIGHSKAVVDLPNSKLHFRGGIAWFLWLFVHLMSLSTPGNKINTLYHWALSYLTKNSSLRMIVRPNKN